MVSVPGAVVSGSRLLLESYLFNVSVVCCCERSVPLVVDVDYQVVSVDRCCLILAFKNSIAFFVFLEVDGF